MHLDTNKTKTKYFNKRRTFKKVLLINVLFYTFIFNWIFSDLVLVFKTSQIFKNPVSVKAAATNQVWNFSSASDYTLGDSTQVEVAGNKGQLKLRSQASDADTKALYLLDENSGTSATDSSSSSPSNTGTIRNGTYESSNFNTGVSFDGTGSYITVPDSASLSLSGTNTLEAQVKFDNNFRPGSHYQRQGIIDKGNYQLYFNNDTGSLVYEMADSSATTWTKAAGDEVNGSWDEDSYYSVETSVVHQGDVYVGLSGAANSTDAEVWKYHDGVWTNLVGSGSYWNSGNYEGVFALTSDGTYLYAGLGNNVAGEAELWRWDGTEWKKVGGDGLYSSWANGVFEVVNTATYMGSSLYVGLGLSAGAADDSEVWRCDNCGTDTPTWTKVGGDNNSTGTINSSWLGSGDFETVNVLRNDGTYLYAGLGASAGDAEVWRCSNCDTSPAWTRIGGDAVNSSWANTTYEYVYSLYTFNSKLYAGLGLTAGDGEVWEWNGTSWTQIGGTASGNWGTANHEGVYSFADDGTYLYAGLGITAGDNEVWKYSGSGTTWTQVGGDAVDLDGAGTGRASFTNTHLKVAALTYNSGTLYAGLNSASATRSGELWALTGSDWEMVGGNGTKKSWGNRGPRTVEVMVSSMDYLYAGLGNTDTGNAQVWRFDGTGWEIIGGNGTNNSWTYLTYETVTSMIMHEGNLYVGLGSSANDAEVWKWDGSTWTKWGGDTVKSSWSTGYEEVNALASYNGKIYAGLGNSANDAEVWTYTGGVTDSWTKIGDAGVAGSWAANVDKVSNIAIYKGKLIATLGLTAGEAEVWEYSGSGTTWTKIGGDAVNSSWDAVNFEVVESAAVYNDKLYIGLGNSADDADIWEYDGSSWTQIGGDAVNNSWNSYTRMKTLAVFNGELYAGLGNGTGFGEVWKYNGSTWSKIGGDTANSGWNAEYEEIESFSAFKGKMYVGMGNTQNADVDVWSLGNNSFVYYTPSDPTIFDAGNWVHIAATYDGSNAKLFVNGTLVKSEAVSRTIPDNSLPLLIGSTFGGREYGKPQGYFQGSIDEVRISSVARTSFISSPYATTAQTITVASALNSNVLQSFDGFSSTATLNGGTVKFRFSTDAGSTYKYWDGDSWEVSNSISESSTSSSVGTHLADLPITASGLIWQAVITGTGSSTVSINSVTVDYTTDSSAPDVNATSLAFTNATSGSWTNIEPKITWTAGSDVAGGTGLLGYCVALEEANPADSSTNLDPEISAGGLLNILDDSVDSDACPYIVVGNNIDFSTIPSLSFTTGKQYYFSIKAVDNAGNVYTGSSGTYQNLVNFKYDNNGPDNVDYLITPQRTFGNINDMYFSWPNSGGSAASDVGSELLGYQYQLNSTSAEGWKGTTHSDLLSLDYIPVSDTSYDLTEGDNSTDIVIGTNVVYFRAIDNIGNVSTNISGTLEYGGRAPTFEKECSDLTGIAFTPSASVSNNFALSWGVASAGGGSIDSYYYMINRQPPTSLDTLQSNSTIYIPTDSTSVASGVLPGSVKGVNTVYVVAVDDEGNYSSSNCIKGQYTLNSNVPDPVRNLTAVDASFKSESLWRASISWDEPSYTGTGELTYQIQRSNDNSSWETVSTTTGLSYTETVPESTTYYYRVGVYDTTNTSRNAPTYSTSVDVLTKGSYDTAPDLSSDPKVSNITTKRATINWSTGRIADSKIAYGTKSGTYFDSEPSSSTQVTSHEILLNNLTPGTKYYYQAKWTDEDGNLGVSSEYTFTTSPAPSVSDVTAENISISSAVIKFKSKNGETALLQFGESITYGGSETIGISNSESNYSIQLSGLKDNTTYHYRLILKDTEADSYEFEDHVFTTLPRPKIENVRIQQVPQAAQPTVLILWKTNTPITSVATYTSGSDALKEVNLELSTLHKVILKNLKPNTKYSMVISGSDKAGNEATSDAQYFTTSTDTRPAEILNLEVKSVIKGVGDTATAQIVVSWDTDEDTSSQVEYGQGTGTTYSQKSGEDRALVKNHTIILTNLSPSQVYHLRAVSKDAAGNTTESIDTVTVTQKAVDSALDLVVQNLSEAFGFISKLK